ncbi:MAG: hypothetical protein ACI3ZL_04805 [Candidatus Cryptobacteroides sp.]
MENNDTLTEMRQQMQILREKLENQKIVNNRILKKSYRNGLSSLKARSSATYYFAAVAMLLAPSLHLNGFSIWFVGLTELMMIGCIIATVITNRHLPDMNSDLVSAAEGLSRFKMMYVEWLKYGILLMLFWIGWMVGEIIVRDFAEGSRIAFICGAGAGIIIGLIIGFSIRRKIIRSTEELISQLESIKETE